MQFHGVMKTSRSLDNQGTRTYPRVLGTDIPDETLYLVSEYATEGNLFDYLSKILCGRYQDWDTIIFLMEGVVAKLKLYHEDKLFHR